MTAFPTTGILDDFNRADESPLNIASSGDVWGTTLWYTHGGTASGLRVISNQCVLSGVSGIYAQALRGSYGSDCEAYCTVSSFGGLAATNFVLKFLLRGAVLGAGNTTGYALWVIHDSSEAAGKVRFDMSRELGSDNRSFFTPEPHFSPQDGDGIGFSAVGQSLIGWWKPQASGWTPMYQVFDSTYLSAGQIGLEMDDPGTIDNFGGGTRQPEGTILSAVSYTEGLR